MNHDAADLAMFWVGMLFVFTPVTFFGVILGVWWYQQKKRRLAGDFTAENAEYAESNGSTGPLSS